MGHWSGVEEPPIVKELYSYLRFGSKLNLENIRELLSRVGDPHLEFEAIHVTGTKGKGSTSAMIYSILRRAGFRVGLYTSPHLRQFNERIIVDGAGIPYSRLEKHYYELLPHIRAMAAESLSRQPTFFEITTAIAFMEFADRGVDYAVVEVGLGGRLDATNVVRPTMTVITMIGSDHADRLGGTIESIAWEKAGIVKPGIPVVTGADKGLSIIEAVARRRGSPLIKVGERIRILDLKTSLDGTRFTARGRREYRVRIPLIGRHQALNASIAIVVAEEMGLEEYAERGLREVWWPGRFEVVRRRPIVVVDAAHNTDSAITLTRTMMDVGVSPACFIFGIMRDKDVDGFLRTISPHARAIIATAPHYKRAVPPDVLAQRALRWCPWVLWESDHWRALEVASSLCDRIVVTGSIYLLGEMLTGPLNIRN